MTKVEIKELLTFRKKYQNKWVARKPQTGEVLAYDRSLTKLARNLEEKNVDYTVEKVLPLGAAFIPFVCC